MWELIHSNKQKSLLIFLGMGVCLLVLGYFIGSVFDSYYGGYYGIIFGAGIWSILSIVSYFFGDTVFLSLSNARELSPDMHPQLANIVEEMRIAANMATSPKVYLIPEKAPNAFAVGRTPEKSSIAVTAGLLSRLNRDELQGVIAHEMSHITNRDSLYMMFAGLMLGSIVLLSDVFLRTIHFSSLGRYRSRNSSFRGGGQATLILMIVAVVLAILAPVITRLLYFALSRRREYLADACAVRLTRYPEGLASALEKISLETEPLACANKVSAPMYIVNPFAQQHTSVFSLMSTHPPIDERVRILRSMNTGAGLGEYQQAFSAIRNSSAAIIPAAHRADSVSFKTPSVLPSAPFGEIPENIKELGDLVRAAETGAFYTCSCGLKIKVPADLAGSSLSCPRCGLSVAIPHAAATMQVSSEAAQKNPESFEYTRRSSGWESLYCTCGRLIQLSPLFEASSIQCPSCQRAITIKSD